MTEPKFAVEQLVAVYARVDWRPTVCIPETRVKEIVLSERGKKYIHRASGEEWVESETRFLYSVDGSDFYHPDHHLRPIDKDEYLDSTPQELTTPTKA